MHKDKTASGAQQANVGSMERFLAVIARKKIAQGFPDAAGRSYLYDVMTGWETEMLRADPCVRTVKNVGDLEDALRDRGVRAVFIPGESSVTRIAALQVGKRNAQEKTIFYEVGKDE